MTDRSSRVAARTGDADDTALRYAWIILLAVPFWLLLYQVPSSRSEAGAPVFYLWILYLTVVGVEGARTWLIRKAPGHRLHNWFPVFDAVAIGLAIRYTGGVRSEFWLLYVFQLVAAAHNPNPLAIWLLSGLALASYLAAASPDLSLADWSRFLDRLHLPWQAPVLQASYQRPSAAATLIARFFFLFVVAGTAHAIATRRARQEREMTLLREQVAVSEDRARVARDLHDHLNHSLVGSLLRLELVSKLLKRSPEEAAAILDEEKQSLRQAIDGARDVVFFLKTAELSEERLAPILSRYLKRFGERTGLIVEIEIDPIPEPRPVVRAAMARIAQEAMTNTAKHARATKVSLSVRRAESGGIVICFHDDGIGFDSTIHPAGEGLSGMKERVEALDGSIRVVSAPGQGTRITAHFPSG